VPLGGLALAKGIEAVRGGWRDDNGPFTGAPSRRQDRALNRLGRFPGRYIAGAQHARPL